MWLLIFVAKATNQILLVQKHSVHVSNITTIQHAQLGECGSLSTMGAVPVSGFPRGFPM